MTSLLVSAFCLTNANSAWAIAGVDTPPAPSAPHETKFPEPQETTLPNGFRVIVVERHALPLLAMSVVVRHGAEADSTERAGTASMAGDLLTKGTTTMSAPEIATAIESLGGAIESGAGWDQTSASVLVMSDKAEVALKILADVVLHPAFQQEEIDRLKNQRLDGLRVALQQPGALARLVTERVVFGDDEYGHSAKGTLESVQAIKRDDIAQLYRANYRPQDSAFVCAGDITLAQAKEYAQKLFGDWKGEADSPNEKQKPSAAQWKPATIAIDMPEAGQASVILSKPTIKRNSPDYYTGLVANAALGQGFVSRLNREVRIKRGLSYGANSSIDARRDGGVFSASAQTKNESAAEVAGLMAMELKKLVSNPVTGEELKSRQAVLTGGFARNLETNQGFAGQIAALAVYKLPLDTLDKFIPAIDAVTTDKVSAFAKSELATAVNTVVVGKAADFLAALKKSAPDAEVIEQKDLDLNRAALVKNK
ncbi:MAG: insulinase family protein [Chthoniobacterales bacterium]|nr:insulinase family protein [Chthoniobacterales bacterium]